MTVASKFAVGFALVLASSSGAFAGQIFGSESLNAGPWQAGTSPVGFTPTGANTFDITSADFFQTTKFSNNFGFFDYSVDSTGNIPGPWLIDVSGGLGVSTLTIGSLGWGTFSGTLGLDHVDFSGHSVTLGYSGTFSPGSNQTCTFNGVSACTTNTATFEIVLGQTGGAGHAISASETLDTPAVSLTDTPEPATMALFGSALVGFGLLRRRRKV